MSDLSKEIDRFFTEGRREVKEYLTDLGSRAAELNKAEGDYHNRTGNLRRSNFSEADEEGLTLGNSASYASKVESMGYNVIDSGVKLIMEELG